MFLISLSLIAGKKTVADPRLSSDVLRLRRVFFKLLAKLADEDAEVFGLLGKIAAPNSCQDRAMRDHAAAVAE